MLIGNSFIQKEYFMDHRMRSGENAKDEETINSKRSLKYYLSKEK
jgi:hypothetical protein